MDDQWGKLQSSFRRQKGGYNLRKVPTLCYCSKTERECESSMVHMIEQEQNEKAIEHWVIPELVAGSRDQEEAMMTRKASIQANQEQRNEVIVNPRSPKAID